METRFAGIYFSNTVRLDSFALSDLRVAQFFRDHPFG